MEIRNSVAVVTGANRGLGRHFAAQLLERGAAKVYAGSRDAQRVDLPGVVPLQLDITDPASVARAAESAPAATLLVNNAGISTHTRLTDGDLDQIRLEMETGVFGNLAMTRAFAPVLTPTAAARSSTCCPCSPGSTSPTTAPTAPRGPRRTWSGRSSRRRASR